MKLTEKQIDEIAQLLESGMKVYINKDTLEYQSIPDRDDLLDDNEQWEEEQEKIESEWSDYFIIENLESRKAFAIMEAFVHEVPDLEMVERLAGALNRKSPFANFKALVETSAYRNDWIEFRKNAYMEYVSRRFDAELNDIDGFENE